MTSGDTRERIMTAARLTVQDRGYSGLSFRELAKDVGIKSASIHHYFPTKGELGGALAERYRVDFKEYLDGLLAEGLDQTTCFRKYTDVFGATVRNENRMCLAGIMAAEHKELPEEVQAAVVKFGEMNVDWIAKVLSLGSKDEDGSIPRRALAIFAAVQGAQLIARSRGDAAVYDAVITTYRESGLLP
ncbi:TetR/AcrR family transcriptional regulator [Hyphomicrobium sp. 802]|uniref:TetR/AcrR family transcriptional regulator n=1 Tax=Hyphomicrobium sp. 802 TaxID=1112272 RepID=UPI00045EB428|nr:TetR/AcrR family transcriptional regulator [Hyphomicrobium sp. 802]